MGFRIRFEKTLNKYKQMEKEIEQIYKDFRGLSRQDIGNLYAELSKLRNEISALKEGASE